MGGLDQKVGGGTNRKKKILVEPKAKEREETGPWTTAGERVCLKST